MNDDNQLYELASAILDQLITTSALAEKADLPRATALGLAIETSVNLLAHEHGGVEVAEMLSQLARPLRQRRPLKHGCVMEILQRLIKES